MSHITKARLVGYASGNFGKNVVWSTVDLTLLFVLTDVMGVDPATAGWIIFLSLCINAVFDPIVGRFADRIRSPLGRNAPLILIGAPLCAAGFAMLYALPAIGVTSLAVAVICLVTFRLGYSAMDAPHNAQLATLSRSPVGRSSLAGLRFVFSSAATLSVVAIFPALTGPSTSASKSDLAIVTTCAALVSTIVMIVAAVSAMEADRPVPYWRIMSDRLIQRSVKLLSRPVVVLLGIAASLNVGVPLFSKMLLYHATYIAADPDRAESMLIAMVVGQVSGLILWTPMSREKSPRHALVLACVVVCVASMAMFAIGAHSKSTDIAIAFVFGVGSGGIYTLVWVLVAESADDFERESKVAAPSLLFALAIVAIKVGQAIGAAASGQILSAAGYVPRALSTDVSHMIRLIQSGGPILACAIAIAILAGSSRSLRPRQGQWAPLAKGDKTRV